VARELVSLDVDVVLDCGEQGAYGARPLAAARVGVVGQGHGGWGIPVATLRAVNARSGASMSERRRRTRGQDPRHDDRVRAAVDASEQHWRLPPAVFASNDEIAAFLAQVPPPVTVTDVRVLVRGGAQSNPGPGGFAVLLLDGRSGQVVDSIRRQLGTTTSNQAVYRAVLAGVARARGLAAQRVEVFTTLKLLADQVNGIARAKQPDLANLLHQVQEAAAPLSVFTVHWVHAKTPSASSRCTSG
jgi:ribonuclease HI